jgi:hypothetical protein
MHASKFFSAVVFIVISYGTQLSLASGREETISSLPDHGLSQYQKKQIPYSNKNSHNKSPEKDFKKCLLCLEVCDQKLRVLIKNMPEQPDVMIQFAQHVSYMYSLLREFQRDHPEVPPKTQKLLSSQLRKIESYRLMLQDMVKDNKDA